MSSDRPFRQRVLAGETLFGMFLMMGSVVAAEVAARSGLDWVVIDLEHGAADEREAVAMLLAVRSTPVAALMRVEQGARLRIGRALDLGAEGIVVPQVQSADEARDIAAWLRYPPAGRRGIALFTRGMEYGARGHADAAARHETITGIVQIESMQGVEAADAMAAIDGVDVLFVGPADLTHALGVPGRIDDPAYDAAIRRVGAAARAHGKAAGVMVWKLDDAVRYMDAGFTFFSLSADGPVFAGAVASSLAAARALAAG
jgi:2-keto-3-deoxy-L-rhamnonate aldolase RhmA